MHPYTFIKSLTIEERASLAAGIGRKVGYLNTLASTREGMSYKMAGYIFDSEINKSRPNGQRITQTDMNKFRRHKLIERGFKV